MKALEGFRPGTLVYIGGNAIANKVDSPSLPAAPTPHVSNNNSSNEPTASVPDNATPQAGAILENKKGGMQRPCLARSIANARQMIGTEPDRTPQQTLKFEGLDHEKVVSVFNSLHDEIASWQDLATMQEASGSARLQVGHSCFTGLDVPETVRPLFVHLRDVVKTDSVAACGARLDEPWADMRPTHVGCRQRGGGTDRRAGSNHCRAGYTAEGWGSDRVSRVLARP